MSPAMEPTATMYLANMQPCAANISISGASASISVEGTIKVKITETWARRVEESLNKTILLFFFPFYFLNSKCHFHHTSICG